MKLLAALLMTIALVTPAHAEPWYRGKYGKNRVVHLTVAASFGLVFLGSETVFKSTLAPADCRWCNPPAFDHGIRDALVWNNTDRANLYGTIDAYVISPIVGIGLLVASDHDAGWGRVIDDTLPIAETVAISQVVTQMVKFSVGRRRPYATYGTGTSVNDTNLSFWSGHSALAFAITTSGGMIAHWRHYKTEPYIWASGIALSVSTEYLRIAADRHYFSDVLAGGAVGIASGLLVPRLMRRDLKIVPVKNGVSLIGEF